MNTVNAKVAILGAGPAGMAAAVEAKNNRMEFVLIDNEDPGWYAKYSINQHYTVDGYLGAYNMTGSQLAELFHKHLQTKDISVMREKIKYVARNGENFIITCENTEIISKFLVLATGSRPKKLNIENYDRFFGRNIFNFVCKENLNLNNKKVVVLGGRNSGATTAIYIANETSANVILIEKDVKLNATQKYIDRLHQTAVKYMVGTTIFKINGKEQLQSIVVKTNKGEEIEIPSDYMFCCIGMEPNYQFLHCKVDTDYANRIVVNPKTMEAEKNLYAVGDINDLNPKQIANATANGKTAIYYINQKY